MSTNPWQAPTEPGWSAPVIGNSTAGNSSITVSWTFPSSNPPSIMYTDLFLIYVNGNPYHKVLQSEDNPPGSNIFSYTISGLTNGNKYTVTIVAVGPTIFSNSLITIWGSSQPLIINTIPVGPPTGTTTVTATPSNGQVTLGWSAPSNDGGATISYILEYNTTGYSGPWSALATLPASVYSYIVTGLTNGTTYYFQVAATNTYGTSPYYGNSATPVTNPTIPQNFTGTAINGGVNLSWSAPESIGASYISAYNLQYSTAPSGSWSPTYSYGGTITSDSYTSLTNGTLYYFQLQAENNAGLFSVYATTSATPSTIPGAPVITSSTSNQNQTSTVSWTTPSDNGGAPVSSYNLQYSTSSSGPWLPSTPYTVTATSTSYTFTGLTNGTLYYFQVAAVNISGIGTYSAQTTATPSTIPGAPVITSSTSNQNQTSTVSWTAPSDNGGSPISSYNLQYSTSSSGEWLPSTPYTVTAPITSYTFTGLTNGTLYYFQVAAVNPSGQGQYSSQSTNLEQSTSVATPSTTPSAPVITSSTPNQTQTCIVSWTAPPDNGGAAITGYYLQYRASSSGEWLPTTPYIVSAATTSRTFTGLTNGTEYYFQVAAVNISGVGTYSAQTTNSSATPSTIPGAPVITSSDSNENQMSVVSWAAPSDNGGTVITGYILQYSTNSNGPWLPSLPSLPLKPSPATALTYTFTGLTDGVIYYFQVAAVNLNGAGPYSTQTLDSTARPSTVPNAPLIVFSTTRQNTISTVKWDTLNKYEDGGKPIKSYNLQYSTSSSGPWLPTTPYTLLAPATSYTFTDLTNGTEYYFQVAAINVIGTGPYSAQSSTTKAIPSTISDAPVITSSTSKQNQTSTVSWTAPSDNGGSPISSYNLQYSTNLSEWFPKTPHTLSESTSSYTFTDLTNGTEYYFQIAAINANGRSKYSTQTTNSTATPSTIPTYPVITYSISNQNQTSTVIWTEPSDNGGSPISSYNLQYSTSSSGPWLPTTPYTLLAPATSYTFTDLTNGTLYYFQVAAVNLTNGQGPYSSQTANSTATPSTTPSAPIINSATTYQNQTSTVSWTAPSDNGGAAISSYNLQYSTSSSGPWLPTSTTPYTVNAATTSYTFTGLTNGTLYYFQVAAVNSSGVGTYSAQTTISRAMPSSAPVPPVITSSMSNQNQTSTVSWTEPSDNGGAPVSSYNLQYSTSSSGPWLPSTPYNVTAATTSYTFTGLTNGTTYYFQIAAVNLTNGQGAYSQQTAISISLPSTIPSYTVITSSTSNQNQTSTVSWTAPSDNGGAPVSSYNLQYSTSSSGPWLPTTPYTVTAPITSYTFTGLTNGTLYYFQVAAVNPSGQGQYSSQSTNLEQSTSTATPSTTPSAPVITSSASNQNQTSTVSWTAPSDNGGATISSYNLQYSTSSSGPWLPTTPYTVTAPITSYTFTGLTNGTLYYFQVAALNISGVGTYSTQTTISTATPSTIPDPPTNLYGDGSSENGIIYLSWNAPDYDGGAPITSYNLQYCISSTEMWIKMPPYIISSVTVLTYTFTGLTNGTQYDFQIAAVNINGESSYSTNSSTPSTTPDPPVITITNPYNNQTCTVMWNIPYDGGVPISSYNLQYSTSVSGPWVSVSSYLSPTQVTYTFNNLTNDIQYYFKIAAINENGYGNYSAIVNDTPSITSKPPSLINSTAITSSSISLSWNTPSLPSTSSNNVTEYYIQWTDLSSNNTNSGKSSTTTYTITNLTYSTKYEVKISSINGSGIGVLSESPIYFTTLSNLPSAPTNLSITRCATRHYNSIILKWTAPYDSGGSPITNYIIYYRPTENPIAWNTYSTNSDATTATIKGTSTNVLYDFKVSAENSAGVGVFSYIINGSSNNPPSSPTNLTANTTESGLIILNWVQSFQNPPEYISYYFIEYKIDSFGGWLRFKVNIPGDVAEVILDDPNIANNVLYLFRVYAVNSAGAQSESSNITSAMSYNNNLPMYVGSRYSPNCGSNVTTATSPSTDNLEQQMLRKASVLQYFKTGALNFTTKQLWAMAARNGLTRKKSYATQTQDYTNANTTNMTNPTVPNIGLKEVNNSLTCWTPQSSVICNLSSASNVPGTVKSLCFSLKAPYNNYRNPKTYGSGGTKLLFLF